MICTRERERERETETETEREKRERHRQTDRQKQKLRDMSDFAINLSAEIFAIKESFVCEFVASSRKSMTEIFIIFLTFFNPIILRTG